MKEKLGCAVLIAMGLALWIGLIHGCEKFESWKLKRHLQQQDEAAKKGNYKTRRPEFRGRVVRRRCDECEKYDDVLYCEKCEKYLCEDCFIEGRDCKHE